MNDRKCVVCGKPLVNKRISAITCSNACRQRKYERGLRITPSPIDIGTVQDMAVADDLRVLLNALERSGHAKFARKVRVLLDKECL